MRSTRLLFILACFLSLALADTLVWAEAPAVSSRVDDKTIVLNNGLIELTVSRETGQGTSLRDITGPKPRELLAPRNTLYWDANAEIPNPPAGTTPPKKGYFRLGGSADLAKLSTSTPEQAEITVAGGPSTFFQFNVDFHYIVRRGVSGVYLYVNLSHPESLGAARLWQTRFVTRTVEDGTFDYWSVGADSFVKIPTAAPVAKVMDATYRLADGTVKTKYLNSVYWAKAPVYGVVGHDGQQALGLWMIEASPEYHNGGPVKQGQTVHDNVLLRVLQSVHFGASPVDVAAGENWQKLYGPFLLYVNHALDANALWTDANQRLKTEASAWPYAWVDSPNYVKQRGQVSGKLAGGNFGGATVILAEPGTPWTAQGKRYQFWTQADAEGRFTIPNVVPGSYTLYATGADQTEDFSHDGVIVNAEKPTNLGDLEWKPITHGQTLWQIGTFDRSAAEFHNGDTARDYEMFKRYPQQFPNDVTFTIGKSDIRTDWNYAQWSWYAKNPAWKIQFESPKALEGSATLTIAFASAQPATGKTTDLRVAVNGQEVSAIHLPKTGTAGYRGGTQDSPWNVKTISFDAKLLKQGTNEITLRHADGKLFQATTDVAVPEDDESAPPGTGFPGQVMYDALRLEVQPPQALSPNSRYQVGELLASDDFKNGIDQWKSEIEKPGSITANNGVLDIDVPAGLSLWFKTKFTDPVLFQYEATAISNGGENDRVSDLNCFWMATDARNPKDFFAAERSGKFADYNQLLTYYVGLGGNGNTTTRFRRYIGDVDNRPLLPEHDLKGPEVILKPNQLQLIQLIAAGDVVEFYRDGQRLFALKDEHPYPAGWFAFRTVKSHLQIKSFKVFRLHPLPQ